MIENIREILRPTTKMRVYDVVSEAGIDVGDWHNVSSKIKAAQNPNYCYRWAFEGNGLILLCVWYHDLTFDQDGVEYFGNARDEHQKNDEKANDQRDPSLKKRLKKWALSALQMDEVVKIASRRGSRIRIAIVASKALSFSSDERASADFRLLDPEYWELRDYDMQTGAFCLRRGLINPQTPLCLVVDNHEEPSAFSDLIVDMPAITSESYGIGVADQFVASERPDYRSQSATVWERSAQVRQIALARSKGHCEHCGQRGFLKSNGDLYLETHHIVPLSEHGADTPSNVIALCARHHREAHYGADRERLKERFQNLRLHEFHTKNI